MAINISNAKHRDAIVALEAVQPKREVRYVDKRNRPVSTRRLLKADVLHDLPALLKEKNDLESVAEALVKGDPEINMEEAGMLLTDTSRVYVSASGIVHLVEEFEVVKNADGSERLRRPHRKEPQNINSDMPIKWTGKYIKKDKAANRFVFTSKKQLVHVNGLTFDFLFDMAKDLDERDSLLLLRGGEKSDKPILLNRGGRPYNAFLEGRIKGDAYCLILHLSNMELKKPEDAEDV